MHLQLGCYLTMCKRVCIDSLIQALETPMFIITNRKNHSELDLKNWQNQAVDLQKRDAHGRTLTPPLHYSIHYI